MPPEANAVPAAAAPPEGPRAVALTVTLAGRPYPLRVLPDDEEPIRRIARELNAKVAEMQEGYRGRDKQDALAMLLLVYAVDLYKVKDGREAADPQLTRALERLEGTLAEALAPPAEASGGGDVDADLAPEPPPAEASA